QKAPSRDYYDLSAAQRRLYFLYEMDRSSLAYNLPRLIELKGALDLVRLEVAFEKLISRHEILRTRFEVVGDKVYQRIIADVDFKLEFHRSKGPGVDGLAKEFVRPFDLGDAPLLRAGLIEVSDMEHFLMVDMHHIVTDGVSQGILIRDFMRFYNNEEPEALPLQYKDYSEWQQGPEQQARLNSQRGFWLGEFSEEASVLELPTDYPRPRFKSYKGSNISFSLGVETTGRLKALGEEVGATMFMTVLALFNVLLGKLGNREDVTIGTGVAGRHHPDLEGIMGMFVNTLALRNSPQGDMGFKEFLTQVKGRTLCCLDNQDYPYEELIDELQVPRDTGRNPLFDVMFVFQNFTREELGIPGLTLRPYDLAHDISKFDQTLTVMESKDVLHFDFEYSTDLFKRETMERFVTYFKNIVGSVIEDPTVRLSDIAMITP
ncbi:condensation domain-containing protein, partial [Maribacter sp. 2307UL18-2]|uniref:condensation domain-containing protein n=1 Tax=Maribacter sp. 2307UL18-2 TaxID=3386274 RepID=UPI0039BD1B47